MQIMKILYQTSITAYLLSVPCLSLLIEYFACNTIDMKRENMQSVQSRYKYLLSLYLLKKLYNVGNRTNKTWLPGRIAPMKMSKLFFHKTKPT